MTIDVPVFANPLPSWREPRLRIAVRNFRALTRNFATIAPAAGVLPERENPTERILAGWLSNGDWFELQRGDFRMAAEGLEYALRDRELSISAAADGADDLRTANFHMRYALELAGLVGHGAPGVIAERALLRFVGVGNAIVQAGWHVTGHPL